tara:strand:+ start:369 stop:683 length:315 start_codon:yes stop_codon:yes gene_type:complete
MMSFKLSIVLIIATAWACQKFTFSEKDLNKLKATKFCPKCNLKKTNLSGVDLTGANLIGADLTNADLSSADLRKVNLDRTKLSGAVLCKTIMPGGKEDNSGCVG